MKTIVLLAAICAVLTLAAQTRAKPPVPNLAKGKPALSGVWIEEKDWRSRSALRR